MTQTDWIGFIGVTILLIAFLLNLTGRLKRESLIYSLLNFYGCRPGLFCIHFTKLSPFYHFEGCWTLVSAIGILNYVKTHKR